MRRRQAVWAVWALGWGLAVSVRAQTYLFTNASAGSTNGLWSWAGNWTNGTAPVSGTGANLVFTNFASVPLTNDFASGSSFGWVDFQGPFGSTNRVKTAGNYYYFAGLSNEASSTGLTVWNDITVFTNASSFIVNNGGPLWLNAALTNTGGLTFDGTGSSTSLQSIAGSGALTKNGPGALTLNAANTFGGGVTLNSGLLNLLNAGALGTGPFTINGGTNNVSTGNGITNANNNPISLNASYVFTGSKTLALGTGTVTLASNLTLTVNGSTLAFGGAITGLNNGVTLNALDIAKAGAGTLLLAAPITLRGGQTNSVAAGTETITGAIGDGGSNYDFTVVGGGNVLLAASNSYGGATRINATSVYLANTNALGTGSMVFGANGGMLQLANGMTLGGKTISINGNGSTYGVLQVTNNGSATWTGNVVIDDTVAGQPRIGAQSGGTLTVSGSIGNGSGSNLYISAYNGTGKVVLTGTNTYSGLTSLIRGTLQLGATDTLPTNTVLEMRYNSSATDAIVFDLNGFNQTIGVLKDSQGGKTVTLTNSAAGLSTLTLNQYTDSSYQYPIIGNIALVKNGTATITLSGTNAYSGGTTINAGTILFGSTNSMSDPNYFVGSGAGVGVTYAMDQNFLTGRVNLASAGVMVLGANTPSNLDFSAETGANLPGVSLGAYGTVTNSGLLTPYGSTYRLGGGGGTLVLVNPDALSGAGTNLVAFGSGSGGALLLSASNSFGGGTWIGAGTVQVKDPNALGTGAVTNQGTLQFKNGSTITAALGTISGSGLVDYNSFPVYMLASNSYGGGTLLSGGNAGAYLGDDNALGTGTLWVTGSNPTLASSGGVTRTLANALVLSNAVTFGTAANPGTLVLNGGVDLGGGVRKVTINAPVTINGVIGNGGWSNAGTAAVTFTATNTYAGGTILAGGTLSIGSYSNLPVAGGLTFGGGTLQITGTQIGDLGVYNPNWGSFNGGLDINNPANTLSVTNPVGGAGSLTKLGAGTLTLYAISNTIVASGGTLILTGNTDNANASATVTSNATLVLAKQSTSTVHALDYGGSAVSSLLIANGGTVQLAGTGGDQIPDAGRAGIVTNNGVFDLNGNSETIAIMAGSGVTTNSAPTPATLTVNVGGNYVYSGSLLGAIGVQSISNGTWTLSGNHNISGGVTNAGGTGTILLAGNNTLGSVVNNTAGAITLSGSNAIAGGVTVNVGTVNVNNAYALGGGTFTINGGVVDNTSGGTLTNYSGSPIQWNSNFTYKGTGNLALGPSAITLGSSLTVTDAAGVLAVDGAIGDGAGGPYNLTKAGAGALVLRGANTFGGGVTLNAGILRIETPSALGGGTFTINGGTIDSQAGTSFTLNPTPIVVNSNFTFSGTSNLDLGAGAVTLNTNITLTVSARQLNIGGAIGDGGAGYSLTKAGNGKLVLTGASTYSGGTIIPYSSGGWLILSNTTGYALQGNVLLGSSGGDAFLRLGADEQLVPTCILSFGGNASANQYGRFTLLGFQQTIGGINDAGGNSLIQVNDNNASANNGYGGDTNAGPSTLIVNITTATNFTDAGYIRDHYGTGGSGAGYGPSNLLAFVKDGIGTQTLIGSKIIYSGPTTVQGGTLILSNTSLFASSITINGGQLLVSKATDAGSQPLTNNAPNGLGFLSATAFIIGNLSGGSGGSITLTNDGGVAVALTIANTTAGTYAGTLGGSGGLTVLGAGLQVLGGTNTYAGNTVVNGGTLRADLGAGLPTTGNLDLNGGILETGTTFTNALGTGAGQVQVRGNAAGFSAFGGPAVVNLGNGGAPLAWGANFYPTTLVLNGATAANNLTLQNDLDFNGSNSVAISVMALTATLSGNLTNSGATANTTLTKNGAGTLALTGNNYFSSNINVTAGTLLLNGNADSILGALTVGTTAGSSAALVISNAAQVFSGTSVVGGGTGANSNALVLSGSGTTLNLGGSALNIAGGVGTGNWLRVDNNAAALNIGQMRVGATANSLGNGLVVTNGGQLAVTSFIIGRASAANSNGIYVGGGGAQVNNTGRLDIGGYANDGNVNINQQGDYLTIDQGGVATNAGSVYVGAGTNAAGNFLQVINGGQFVSKSASFIGYSAGGNSNWAYIGGGNARWNLSGQVLTLGNAASATGNYATLAAGGVLTNGSVALGGSGSVLNFNGGTLAAGASGNLITGSGSVNVQSGGAVVDTAAFAVTNLLPLLEDPLSPGGGLTKRGAGTLTLSGANGYGGPTLVQAGTLALSGNATLASSALSVLANATFDVSGTPGQTYTLAGGQSLTNQGTFTGGLIIGTNALARGGGLYTGAVTNLAGGTLTPGVGGDTNYFSTLTLASDSTNRFWVGNSATHDLSVVSTQLQVGSYPVLQLDLTSYTAGGGGNIVLYNDLYAGPNSFDGTNQCFRLSDPFGPNDGLILTNGTAFAAVGGNTGATNVFSIHYDLNAGGDGSNNDIALTVIPEPGTAQLLLLLGAAVGLRWYRRPCHRRGG